LAAGEQFDVVCALEVVEHVQAAPAFLATLAGLVRPGGLLFVSTINQTTKSWLLTIVAAEHLLRWVPVGTHDWHKYLSPRTLRELIESAPAHTQVGAVDADRRRPTTPLLPRLRADDPAAQSSEYLAASAAAEAHAKPLRSGMHVTDVCGMIYDPLRGTWSLDRNDTECNYILTAKRAAAETPKP
jgi:2-polyprenyl-3-methyl-5-hydroxy-6-metoxy-1,4-benzoquinol methylase